MSKAISFEAFGGPEQLQYVETDALTPGEGQVLLRQTAVGVNYADLAQLRGVYPGAVAPGGMGAEGAGVVEAVGPGVSNLKVGDRVVCAIYGGPAYAQHRLVTASRAWIIPEAVSDALSVAAFGKALTAWSLVERAYPVKAGDVVLVHAAAGSVGQAASQWAKALGARVIGTVGSDAKVDFARAHGCDEVINYQAEDFVARARELTDGRGVDVVYDSVGKDTFMGSLDALRRRGTLVSFGAASGPIAPLDVAVLGQKGSLNLTRCSLNAFLVDDDEFAAGAARVFEMLASGAISIAIDKTYPLSDSAQALRDLASRKTMGSLVLLPD
jgi:NADPH2:quinone reductase